MSSVTAKRFSLDEYHRLTKLGFLSESDRVELIRGELVQMAAKGTAHEVCLTRLNRALILALGDQAIVRCQSPIALPPDSEPEPDFAIVRHRSDDYLNAHPDSADILVAIELSDSSLTYDQTTKLTLYAEHQIQEYWIFNLVEMIVECYSDPYQTLQGHAGYRVKRVVLPNESISFSGLNFTLELSPLFPQAI